MADSPILSESMGIIGIIVMRIKWGKCVAVLRLHLTNMKINSLIEVTEKGFLFVGLIRKTNSESDSLGCLSPNSKQ